VKPWGLGSEGLKTREFSNKCTYAPEAIPWGSIYMGN
jgi:hypothetical protein